MLSGLLVHANLSKGVPLLTDQEQQNQRKRYWQLECNYAASTESGLSSKCKRPWACMLVHLSRLTFALLRGATSFDML